MGHRRGRLSAQILAGQVAVLVLTTSAGLLLYARHRRADIDRQFEQRALVVAEAAAAQMDIRTAMAAGDADRTVAPMAEAIRKATHATYVVVIDRAGVRHSHPNTSLIGQRVEEPIIALDGANHVGVDNGHLGRSANGKAPLRAPDGRIIGEVSAGLLEQQVTSAVARGLPALLLYSGLALGFGVVVSLLLARRLKRRTFGLELDEIADLLQEREAMLHGIREGVIIVDNAGDISLINDAAREFLDLDAAVGSRVDAALPAGRLRDLVDGRADGTADETVTTADRCLVVARMPVSLGGRPLGAVVTIADQTELIGLLRELDSVRRLTDALRAQQHEHANRMHTVAGLIELGRFEEATAYLQEIAGTSAAYVESLQNCVAEPAVVALLLGKQAVAAEHGVTLVIDTAAAPEGVTTGDLSLRPTELVTVVGNLVDNAIDAVRDTPHPTVTVRFQRDSTQLVIEVADSGPGPHDELHDDPQRWFVDGYSTKAPRPEGIHRGLGLALVRRLVLRTGGTIAVDATAGTVFRVRVPVGPA